MILVNGKNTNRIDPLDRGFAYGDGMFRTMRNRDARPLHWSLHFEKVVHDCIRLNLRCPSHNGLLAEVLQVAAAHPEGVTKLIVTRGESGRGYGAPSQPSMTRVVYSFPLAPMARRSFESGVTVRWCRTQVSMQPDLAGVKHLNRLDCVLARSEWTSPDIAEGLLLDRDGWVIEGTMSNVFILEGDSLTTPLLDQAGVAGVQRVRLRNSAARIGLACREDRISRQRLLAADAVFLTNSVIGLWWVSRLEERTWPFLPVTARLMKLIDAYDDD